MKLPSPLATPLCWLLGCELPILQAGMGGVARSELVAAVARAGAFGFLGMVREPPSLIAQEIAAVRRRTDRPFGVNLIPSATDPALFAAELDTCLERAVEALCFFWDVDAAAVARAKAGGAKVLYQVGSVEDAIAAEQAGADAIIAQGAEAGGHVRGQVSSLVLLPQIVSAVSVPVVASGGFATGDSLVAALALGAQGIHCGTAFLATEESYAHAYHKSRVVDAASQDTVYTDVFSINWPPGAAVRVIANSVTAAFADRLCGHRPEDFDREAIAWNEERDFYRFSTDSPLRSMQGDLEAMALYAGQVAGRVTSVTSAAARVLEIQEAAQQTLEKLQKLGVYGR
jgi:nitronate monooxygenase